MGSAAASRLALVALWGLTSACHGLRPDTDVHPDQSIITAAQLQKHRFPNLKEAIESLHSNWLRARGPNSLAKPTEVKVYFDNVHMGGVEVLSTMSIGNVVYIRFFDGLSATTRWGVDHGAGVIYVSTHPA